MAKVKIEMNFAGLVDLMKSPEIVSALESEARRRTEATGMTYKPDVYPNGKTRANAGAYDQMRDESGHYKRRGNGKIVYTERKIKRDSK